ncbi:hypothetical protein [Streptomyces sp. NPDC001435]|uniref:hypothetical protein n=1 Tax=Streptomyces sp. NPDC001435 TaxID=3364576 RepID=UPI0036C12CFC
MERERPGRFGFFVFHPVGEIARAAAGADIAKSVGRAVTPTGSPVTALDSLQTTARTADSRDAG